ncbi:hypothetical protein [Streptacidiphilus sp. P02-A3a]|uniref:hypothetical protein n=1 Tax=Streptacidiphilus sp. P02-A3a TaxID=2704468 RepID=UPI0015FC98D3|nr:hypothetical protein [Streptacidiphilus sp. P02-A3a]QMU70123.1 hypothetical protein GXP74_19700 [Streptacidiphilus sp. P02-A3a]
MLVRVTGHGGGISGPQIAFEVLPLCLLAAFVGVVALFNPLEIRSKVLHRGITYDQFLRDAPAARVIIPLLGVAFLVIGSLFTAVVIAILLFL